jgi:hypothetical protein
MTGKVFVLISMILSVVFTIGCRKNTDSYPDVVKVSSSAVYCIFDPSCTVTVTDISTTPIPMQAGGSSVLQSRTFAGKPGTPASGLYGYEYRLDLEKAVETMVDVDGVATKYTPCLESITIEFGPIIDHLDYNGDGEARDLIYVVTSGGPGSVGVGRVHRWPNRFMVTFDSPLCVGGSDHPGNSSYFFGLVSTQPPRSVTASIKEMRSPSTVLPRFTKNLRRDVLVLAPQIGTASAPDRP